MDSLVERVPWLPFCPEFLLSSLSCLASTQLTTSVEDFVPPAKWLHWPRADMTVKNLAVYYHVIDAVHGNLWQVFSSRSVATAFPRPYTLPDTHSGKFARLPTKTIQLAELVYFMFRKEERGENTDKVGVVGTDGRRNEPASLLVYVFAGTPLPNRSFLLAVLRCSETRGKRTKPLNATRCHRR